jgi:hypothetical protein
MSAKSYAAITGAQYGYSFDLIIWYAHFKAPFFVLGTAEIGRCFTLIAT